MKHAMIAGAVIFLLVGCAGGPRRVDSPSSASDGVSKYGIRTVYPFRQDLWIGDVYVTPITYEKWKSIVDQGGQAPLAIRAYRHDLNGALRKFDEKLPKFQSENPKSDLARKFRLDGVDMFLKPAAAPAYSSASGLGLSGSLAGSVQLLSFGLSGAFTKKVNFSVAIPDLMSIGIPAGDQAVNEILNGDIESVIHLNSGVLDSQATCRMKRKVETCELFASLITEVYYSRKISIDVASNYDLNVGAAADAKLTVAELVKLLTGEVSKTLSSTTNKTKKAVLDAIPNNKLTDAALSDLDKKLDGILGVANKSVEGTVNAALKPLEAIASAAALPGLGQLGGALNVVSSNKRAATLVANLDTPVVVGFRGLDLKWVSVRSGDGNDRRKYVFAGAQTPKEAIQQPRQPTSSAGGRIEAGCKKYISDDPASKELFNNCLKGVEKGK